MKPYPNRGDNPTGHCKWSRHEKCYGTLLLTSGKLYECTCDCHGD